MPSLVGSEMCIRDRINSRSLFSDRKLADKVLNNYGRHLLNMCTSLGLCILNGICNGDFDGQFTYISQTGNSVNDYFLLSKDLFSIVYSSCKLLVSDRLDSDHSPVELHFKFSETSIRYLDTENDQFVEKIVWNHDLEQSYIDALNSDEGLAMLNHAIGLIDNDYNDALAEFNEFIRKCGVCMERKICLNKRDKQNDWYDNDCRASKSNAKRLLKTFRQSKYIKDSEAYCKARREYKNMLKRKEK
eukprot:TRINITY_DN31284_c1_g1_i11.p1 TRINITY_DN31284_c1_g1~~TRINITY_DN31284_c1_g1_i11.p1  ORF type:complete len:245 (-),score=15.35 TRINITY_DN31284_c1_g1_i11:10-744(-)